jgi:cell division protease FtsH
MEKDKQFNIAYFIFAALLVLLIQNVLVSYQAIERIPYSEFLTLVESDKVTDVVIKETTVTGTLKEPINGHTKFITEKVEPELAKNLSEKGIEFTGGTEATLFGQVLSWLMPILFFVAIWYFLLRGVFARQGLGGMMNVGKSKAKVYVEKETGVTFDDVAGVDEAKKELQEVVSFLQDKEAFGKLGARMPKGILLVGPPGTGKTLLARAVAGEAKVPFFSIGGSEFVEMFVGVGAARVRDLFEQARKVAPCIIFIDELDSLGRARGGASYGGGHSEKEQTLNQLLNELDGFDPREGIVLLAATNRPEVLDPALKRAGRFDRQIVVDRPDRVGRSAILKVHIRKIQVDPSLDVDKIAGITIGFSGADLANLVNEAAIVATRRGGKQVTLDDFTHAVERIIAGTEQATRLMNPKDRQRVAYHEMGHALAATNLPGADPVHKVSIIPRSIGALGYTLTRPTEDRFLITMEDLKNRMVMLLAGRAAEQLTFGEITTGAADDLVKATDIARQIVTRFGMTPNVGQAVLEKQSTSFLGDASAGSGSAKDYSEATAREIDLAVRELIDEAYRRAMDLLTTHSGDLSRGAELLLERETITPDEFPPLQRSAEGISMAAE